MRSFLLLLAGCVPRPPGTAGLGDVCMESLLDALPEGTDLDPTFAAAAGHAAAMGVGRVPVAQVDVARAGGVDVVLRVNTLELPPGECPTAGALVPAVPFPSGYRAVAGLGKVVTAGQARWGLVVGLRGAVAERAGDALWLRPLQATASAELLQLDGTHLTRSPLFIGNDGAIAVPGTARPGWAEVVAKDGESLRTLALLPPDTPAPVNLGDDLGKALVALRPTPTGRVVPAALGPCGSPVDALEGIPYQRTQRCVGVLGAGSVTDAVEIVATRPLAAIIWSDPTYGAIAFERDAAEQVWLRGLREVTPATTEGLQAEVEARLRNLYPAATRRAPPALAPLLDAWIAAGATEEAPGTDILASMAAKWTPGPRYGFVRARDQTVDGLLARLPALDDVTTWTVVAKVAPGPEGDVRMHVIVLLGGR